MNVKYDALLDAAERVKALILAGNGSPEDYADAILPIFPNDVVGDWAVEDLRARLDGMEELLVHARGVIALWQPSTPTRDAVVGLFRFASGLYLSKDKMSGKMGDAFRQRLADELDKLVALSLPPKGGPVGDTGIHVQRLDSTQVDPATTGVAWPVDPNIDGGLDH